MPIRSHAGGRCLALCRALQVFECMPSLACPCPAGKLLDWLLGEESALFRRQELRALVGLHAEPQQDGSGGFSRPAAGVAPGRARPAQLAAVRGRPLRADQSRREAHPSSLPIPPLPSAVGALTSDEAQVIQGALDMASKTAEAAMTPLSKVRDAAALGVKSTRGTNGNSTGRGPRPPGCFPHVG